MAPERHTPSPPDGRGGTGQPGCSAARSGGGPGGLTSEAPDGRTGCTSGSSDRRPGGAAERPAGRHDGHGAHRVDDADILAAAKECVLERGVRRTTLTEIARRAGISRMTLYRRYPDATSVLTALMTSEFLSILHSAQDQAGSGSARRRLVNAATAAVRRLQESPLLHRVLDADAELLVPYLVQRLGSTQLAAEHFLLEHLAEGHRDGSVRRGDPAAQARTLLLLTQSFVISGQPAAAGLAPGALAAELTEVLDAALHPADRRSEPT